MSRSCLERRYSTTTGIHSSKTSARGRRRSPEAEPREREQRAAECPAITSVSRSRLVRRHASKRRLAGASGDFQTRNSTEIPPLAAGFEYVIASELPAAARRLGEEAIEKMTAAPVAPGRYDLILHPSNLYLTIHESIGHATELDRALGTRRTGAARAFWHRPKPCSAGSAMGPSS